MMAKQNSDPGKGAGADLESPFTLAIASLIATCDWVWTDVRDAVWPSVPMPYHIRILSAVVVYCVAMDTSAAGQLEAKAVPWARACPDKHEALARWRQRRSKQPHFRRDLPGWV